MDVPTTLPASWYCSKPIHMLERRAVFLRSWYFLGTLSKFESGNDLRFEIAQIALIARTTLAGDQKEVNTYAETSITIQGEQLHSHQTRSGLVFSTISSHAPPFEEFYPGLEKLVEAYDFTQIPYRRSLAYDGNFNWKTMMDGFQECLHCQFTHPGLSRLYPPTFYRVINHHNWSRHFATRDESQDGLFLYFFPNTTLNLYNGGISSFRACPTPKPGVSRMEFDYYHQASGEPFEVYYKFVRQVANEDFDLCERAQANLERGIYTEGCLNPEKENGVAHYQQRVFEMVMAQHAEEKKVTLSAH
ncbi:Ring hydroxylating alpha subunit catalytic domain-containing protein [Cladophialophora immunda]|nr:Ring hydroxylating alpha subunit catalytic domain-containing protein [Cladophialophora immunda]